MLNKLLLPAIAAGLWAGIALLAGIAWMAFVKPPEPAAPAAPVAATIEAAPKPVSAEVFDLRSRCDALSRKVMEDNIADAVSWDDSRRRVGQDSYGRDGIEGQFTQKSHYDPATGHCYAQIERSYDARDGKGKFKLNVHIHATQLFDAHTRELLAFRTLTDSGDGTGHKNSQAILDDTYSCSDRWDTAHGVAEVYMSELMFDRPKKACP